MGLFAKIKNWWDLRQAVKQFDKEVDENINMYYHRDSVSEIQEDQDVQQKYYNGMALLKSELRKLTANGEAERVMERFKGGKDFYVGKDLLSLAKSQSREKKQLADGLSQVFVYQGADVKNAQDEAKMIDKRIGHYGKLQKSKEERALLRQIRTAYAEGKTVLHEALMQEWKDKYGKSRNY